MGLVFHTCTLYISKTLFLLNHKKWLIALSKFKACGLIPLFLHGILVNTFIVCPLGGGTKMPTIPMKNVNKTLG